jgi:deazaflavin-dependent oxidoreductase (nitroreductase family)
MIQSSFQKPSAVERLFNRIFGLWVGLGLGLSHNYVLQVRGRKTGRMYSTPVNLLYVDGEKYLVAPRGEAHWVRNVRASGEIWLKKAFRREHFLVKEVSAPERPVLLKEYLERYRKTVQRYFTVPVGSDKEAFEGISERHPVFRLESQRD